MNGFIEQWMPTIDISSGGATLSFPINFSNTNYTFISSFAMNGSTNGQCFFRTKTKNSIIVYTTNGYGNSIDYKVVGY